MRRPVDTPRFHMNVVRHYGHITVDIVTDTDALGHVIELRMQTGAHA